MGQGIHQEGDACNERCERALRARSQHNEVALYHSGADKHNNLAPLSSFYHLRASGASALQSSLALPLTNWTGCCFEPCLTFQVTTTFCTPVLLCIIQVTCFTDVHSLIEHFLISKTRVFSHLSCCFHKVTSLLGDGGKLSWIHLSPWKFSGHNLNPLNASWVMSCFTPPIM